MKKISDNILCEVDKCIYCGNIKNLTKEHIIPYGLNGYWIIRNGSCNECAKITSEFERQVLSETMKAPRKYLNFRSRHKKKQPNNFPIKILNLDGSTKKLNVPIGEYPSYLLFPTQHDIISIQTNSIENLKNIYRDKKIRIEYRLNGKSFARMLAKIAYGFSICCFGLENFKEVYVIPSILGEKDDIHRWVSCVNETEKSEDEKHILHNIIVDIIDHEVIVKIKLFAFYPFVPEYRVKVGNLNI